MHRSDSVSARTRLDEGEHHLRRGGNGRMWVTKKQLKLIVLQPRYESSSNRPMDVTMQRLHSIDLERLDAGITSGQLWDCVSRMWMWMWMQMQTRVR